MSTEQKKDLIIEANWPMVASITGCIILFKLSKHIIKDIFNNTK